MPSEQPLEKSAPARGLFSPEAILTVLDAGLAIGFIALLAQLLLSPREMAATDFSVFRAGWWLVRHAPAQLYDAAAQADAEQSIMGHDGSGPFTGGFMAFLHPPQAALAGSPLGWVAEQLGGPAAFRLWMGASLTFAGLLVGRIRRELSLSARETVVAAIALLAFTPFFDAVREGQVSVLLALAAMAIPVAVREGRYGTAAAWLLALSIKPQTLPPLIAVLCARREWRVLSWASLFFLLAFLGTAFALGPSVWWDYATHVRPLESLFGAGTPIYMPTLRGILSRNLGPEHAGTISGITLASWLVAIVVAYVRADRRRRRGEPATEDFAFGYAVGLLTSPHLFTQDVLLWVPAIALGMAARRGEARPGRNVARAVLATPLWFAASKLADGGALARLPIDPAMLPLIVATLWIGRRGAAPAPEVPV